MNGTCGGSRIVSSGVIELRLPDHGDYYSDITVVAGQFPSFVIYHLSFSTYIVDVIDTIILMSPAFTRSDNST